MPLPLRHTEWMDADSFLAWCEAEANPDGPRYELVDGVPVEMMAGATADHDTIVVNLIIGLGTRLKPPCAPRTADQAVKTRNARRVRRPDVIVDCGPRRGKDLFAPNPVALFEVISPSTANEILTKLDEYKEIETVWHVVVLDQDRLVLMHHVRAEDRAWAIEELEGPDAVLRLAAVQVELRLAGIYAGVSFAGGLD